MNLALPNLATPQKSRSRQIVYWINACLTACFLLSTTASGQEFYKYKDDKGRWVFTDQKPNSTKEPEKVHYDNTEKAKIKPKLYTKRSNGNNILAVKNPFYAPIDIQVKSSLFGKLHHRQIIPAASEVILYRGKQTIPSYKYRWVLGDPKAQEDGSYFHIPLISKQKLKITQSFNGLFSHSKEPNIYAVDIAVLVGTYISAAREGVVTSVKDDYHMSGRDKYFLDKANYVKVLHSDGTYAVYAHILQDTLLVKPGDTVKAGDKLARSGSSGYSTGPHIHFVIHKNFGFETRSVPFTFIAADGTLFVPKKGMRIAGAP